MSTPSTEQAFDTWLEALAPRLGHADRVRSFRGYCRGLMLPLERKSIEPIAAAIDPYQVQARHQALHHFVAKGGWSDQALLSGVAEQVLPEMLAGETPFWIIDDTGMRKKGRHSVGVARQYCGEIGKQDNCQVAVSLSVATREASLPVAWRLYLPKSWTDDADRCRRVGVPDSVGFRTKPEMALEQIRETLDAGLTPGVVLADAAYGKVTAWREQLAQWGLTYNVGVQEDAGVWAPGTAPLPPQWSGQGRPPTRPRQSPDHHPLSVRALAESLEDGAFAPVSWREGTRKRLTSRFAAVQVRAARGTAWRDPEWLLIEWPAGDEKPAKYWLSNQDETTSLEHLVYTAKGRWRIERDYQELKQEFGLNEYEGRNWRGFHHHASLCIATYGFLVRERLRCGGKKKVELPTPAVPESYRPRGTPKGSAACS